MTKANRLPLELLFEQHVSSQAKLDPSGRFVATLEENRSLLRIRDMHTGRISTTSVQKGMPKNSLSWSRDGTTLFVLTRGAACCQIQSVCQDDGSISSVVSLPFRHAIFVENLRFQPGRRKIILSVTNETSTSTPWSIDLTSGFCLPLDENCGSTYFWLCDGAGTLRAEYAALDSGETVLRHAAGYRSPIEVIQQWSIDDAMHSRPLEVSSSGKTIFLLDSTGRDVSALTKYCLGDKEFSQCYDVSTGGEIAHIVVPEGSESATLVGIQQDQMEWHALNEAGQMCLDRIVSHVGRHFNIVDCDASATSFIVSIETRSGSLSIIHIDSRNNVATPLWNKRTWLDNVQLSKTESYSIPTRDGGKVECYVTRSRQASMEPVRALIVCIHAGPWTRDTAGFHRTSHWMSDMGFDCIRVNFRGSSGYGKKFMSAGERKWGTQTCEDIEDALIWASKNGIGANGKTILFGHSFGGYAALMCAASFGEGIIATVALSAPCDLVAHVRNHTGEGMRSAPLWRKLVGNAYAGENELLQQSPLRHAASITCPTFLAHGDSDTVVPPTHSQSMANALEEANSPFQLFTIKNASHAYSFETRMIVAEEVEAFLDRNLGAST